MTLSLVVRRFICVNTDCAARTFAEQVDGLTRKWSRRTNQLTSMLTNIGLSLAGRAGARLAGQLGLPTSRDTLLRLVRAVPDPPVGMVRVLGVDDFAVRHGRRYGTILLDMATPVRYADDFVIMVHGTQQHAEHLRAEVSEVLAPLGLRLSESKTRIVHLADGFDFLGFRIAWMRKRGTGKWHVYTFVADKPVLAFKRKIRALTRRLSHLDYRVALVRINQIQRGWANYFKHAVAKHTPRPARRTRRAQRESITTTMLSGRKALPAVVERAVADDSVGQMGTVGGDRCARLRARTRERYDAVQRLRAQGMGLRTIAKELDIDRKTARRFAAADSPEDIIAATTARDGMIDEYVPHLLARWNAGHTNVAALVAELRELGYRGSPNTVYRFLRPYQATKASARPAATPPPKPKVRAVTSWIMRDPDTLPDAETQQLTAILGHCPELAATRRHVGTFAVIMRDRRGDRLPGWMTHVRADNLPALHAFVTGLEHDFAAVTAGLTLPWSNGPTEGPVNKLKHQKRQCFGRAKLDLLRKRLLLSHATVGLPTPAK
ncbi:Transposase and inactivated derivatives [Nocardia africana]|uniref:Transposase and inactivated derivatives n=2 Tax=Nocardia africana TaxID=134964 RepID=A0A378X1E8_9NOCA|nr:Transposase and inactivated derivatives [Nocardia africana]